MLKILFASLLILSSLYAKEYTINFLGDEEKENLTVKLTLESDAEGKPLPKQKVDIRNLDKIDSLKILTAPGLLGTLKDEREILAYYKTNLNVGGMKIRNLYKAGVVRVYGEENNITITFEKDHYQNIVSFLRYHNIKQDVIDDIDNMYGTWNEIE